MPYMAHKGCSFLKKVILHSFPQILLSEREGHAISFPMLHNDRRCLPFVWCPLYHYRKCGNNSPRTEVRRQVEMVRDQMFYLIACFVLPELAW